MFNREPHEDSLLLMQPYDGTFLVSVRYPWKYATRLESNDDYLFDLSVDPMESENLFYQGHPVASLFSRDINRFFANEVLVSENRIWPSLEFQKENWR